MKHLIIDMKISSCIACYWHNCDCNDDLAEYDYCSNPVWLLQGWEMEIPDITTIPDFCPLQDVEALE